MAETLYHRGSLEGHAGWVTSIATPLDPNSDTILSSSRWVPYQIRSYIIDSLKQKSGRMLVFIYVQLLDQSSLW